MWAVVGVIVVLGGLRLLAGTSLPFVQPAAKGVLAAFDYGKAA